MRLILFILLCFNLSAQSDFESLKVATQSLDSPLSNSPMTWEKSMYGTMDQRFKFKIWMLTDQSKYIGAYQFEHSSEIHPFEGEVTEDQVILNVWSDDYNLAGLITGDFNNEVFYGTWRSKDGLEEYAFIAYDNESQIKLDWVKSFKNQNDFILIKYIGDQYQAEGLIHGIYHKGILVEKGEHLYEWNFDSVDNQNSNTALIHLRGESIHFHNDAEISIALEKNNEVTFIIDVPKSLDKSYVMTPLWGNAKLTKNWKSFLERYLDFDYSDSMQVNIEVEIDYLDHNIVSGIVSNQNKYSNRLDESAFWVNLKKKKVYQCQNVLPKDHNLQDYWKNNPCANFNTSFDQLLITKSFEGLKVRSPFSTIYGQKTCLIPFSNLSFKI